MWPNPQFAAENFIFLCSVISPISKCESNIFHPDVLLGWQKTKISFLWFFLFVSFIVWHSKRISLQLWVIYSNYSMKVEVLCSTSERAYRLVLFKTDRDHKDFKNTNFRRNLLIELSSEKVLKEDFDQFKFLVNNLRESNGAMKEKYARRNQAPFVNKSIRKAIITRTCLLHKFRKENSFQSVGT